MQGLSERQYAEQIGRSRPAVQKMKRAGKLVLFPDGSINAAASDARRAENTDPAQERGNGPPAAQAATGDPGGDAEALPEGDGKLPPFLRARTMHEVLKVQERRIAVEVKKGALVDKAKAEAMVFRLAREERDAWITWPARAAPVIAAEIEQALAEEGVREIEVSVALVQGILERHVSEHLEALADLRVSLG